jgi:uncharacterized protein (TIGR03437 family)
MGSAIWATGMANVSGNTVTATGQGPYAVGSDCSGTASVTNQSGTANYYIAVVEDGQIVLFLQSDSGYVVGGSAQPLFATPQSAVVNSASFAPALAPGGLFSIFGTGLPQSPTSAQVVVNGKNAPVVFANGTQINAQMPYDAPTDQPALLQVLNGGKASNAVLLNLRNAAPGIFAYSGNRAVVENQDYSVNASGNPAPAGGVVTAYLTGPGMVNPPVGTGSPAPSAPLSYVSAPYSFTIGGAQAEVDYFGLTPGFFGLYQANLRVPNLGPGDYPIVANVAGSTSNGPLISIR